MNAEMLAELKEHAETSLALWDTLAEAFVKPDVPDHVHLARIMKSFHLLELDESPEAITASVLILVNVLKNCGLRLAEAVADPESFTPVVLVALNAADDMRVLLKLIP